MKPRALVVVLALLLAPSCASGTTAGTADLGSDPGEAAAAATATTAPTPVDVVIAPTPTPDGPRPLVVATVLGETGVMSPLDGPALAGVSAAVDALNDGGGVLDRSIVLQRHDTTSRLSVADRIASRIVEQRPDLIIVSCDVAFSEALLDRADAAGLLTISPCADDPGYATGAWGPRNFTMGAPPEAQGVIAAEKALERYGPSAMVLRDVTSPEALGFCDAFERTYRDLGGTVAYRDQFTYDTLEPIQDRLAERGRPTDLIVVCSHVPGGIDAAPSVITMVRTLGFDAPIVAGSTLDESSWLTSVPVLGELLFVSWSSSFGNDPDVAVNELVTAAASDEETPAPGVSTTLGADAITAWAQAAVSVRSVDPGPVAAALGAFDGQDFLTGQVSFVGGARMDTSRRYRLLHVVEGELTVLEIVEAS